MNNHKLLIILVIVILVMFGLIYFSTLPRPQSSISPTPSPASSSSDDESTAINADLQGIDVGDLDSEFSDIDRDLNSL